jgi:Thrombospondin type 3 repeat
VIAALNLLALALSLAPAAPPPDHGDDERWITRHHPVRGMWELGSFAGAFIIARPHDFYDSQLGYRRLRRGAPDIGLRAAFYPLAFLGIEGEFAGMFSAAKYGGQPAFLYGLRLHAILQLPMYRVTPFVLGGYGLGGIRSPRDAFGNDIDPIGHYGGGVKLFASRWIALRLEGRHLIGPAAQQRRRIASHGEVLFGVSVTLGRAGRSQQSAALSSAPPDGDGDGILDAHDRCPALAGTTADGCAPVDGDGDGILDRHDACPQTAGTDATGCAPEPAEAPPEPPQPEPAPEASKLP